MLYVECHTTAPQTKKTYFSIPHSTALINGGEFPRAVNIGVENSKWWINYTSSEIFSPQRKTTDRKNDLLNAAPISLWTANTSNDYQRCQAVRKRSAVISENGVFLYSKAKRKKKNSTRTWHTTQLLADYYSESELSPRWSDSEPELDGYFRQTTQLQTEVLSSDIIKAQQCLLFEDLHKQTKQSSNSCSALDTKETTESYMTHTPMQLTPVYYDNDKHLYKTNWSKPQCYKDNSLQPFEPLSDNMCCQLCEAIREFLIRYYVPHTGLIRQPKLRNIENCITKKSWLNLSTLSSIKAQSLKAQQIWLKKLSDASSLEEFLLKVCYLILELLQRVHNKLMNATAFNKLSTPFYISERTAVIKSERINQIRWHAKVYEYQADSSRFIIEHFSADKKDEPEDLKTRYQICQHIQSNAYYQSHYGESGAVCHPRGEFSQHPLNNSCMIRRFAHTLWSLGRTPSKCTTGALQSVELSAMQVNNMHPTSQHNRWSLVMDANESINTTDCLDYMKQHIIGLLYTALFEPASKISTVYNELPAYTNSINKRSCVKNFDMKSPDIQLPSSTYNVFEFPPLFELAETKLCAKLCQTICDANYLGNGSSNRFPPTPLVFLKHIFGQNPEQETISCSAYNQKKNELKECTLAKLKQKPDSPMLSIQPKIDESDCIDTDLSTWTFLDEEEVPKLEDVPFEEDWVMLENIV